MYTTKPNLLIGFHGCEESDQHKLLSNISFFKKSQEAYDWLGHGMYFWEGNEKRAWDWAKMKQKTGKLKKSAVIGAVIDLGKCFDLLDSTNIDTLKKYYKAFAQESKKAGFEIPKNADHPNAKLKGDKVLRYLDCAIIQYTQSILSLKGEIPFDSIRAAFIEGEPIYPSAGFHEKTHIQICIVNPNCIKGVFLPRKRNTNFRQA